MRRRDRGDQAHHVADGGGRAGGRSPSTRSRQNTQRRLARSSAFQPTASRVVSARVSDTQYDLMPTRADAIVGPRGLFTLPRRASTRPAAGGQSHQPCSARRRRQPRAVRTRDAREPGQQLTLADVQVARHIRGTGLCAVVSVAAPMVAMTAQTIEQGQQHSISPTITAALPPRGAAPSGLLAAGRFLRRRWHHRHRLSPVTRARHAARPPRSRARLQPNLLLNPVYVVVKSPLGHEITKRNPLVRSPTSSASARANGP